MKNAIIIAAISLFILSGCQKNIGTVSKKISSEDMSQSKPSSEYINALYYGVSDRVYRMPNNDTASWTTDGVARISVWLQFAQDNYSSSRADYLEILLSDTFTNKIDGNDMIKTVDSTDNIAIKNNGTHFLLWKEQRSYQPSVIALKSWNYTTDSYFFKFMGSNFPPQSRAFLRDKYFGTYTEIDMTDPHYVYWYPFNVAGDDIVNGILQNDPHRFEIIIKSD